MNTETEKYLERELAFLSSAGDELAAHFARSYPAEAGYAGFLARTRPQVAAGLQADAQLAPDPHTERLIQGFALLAGRIHHKIDEEFPQLTEALLGVLYPHLLLPVPSLAMAQFTPGPTPGRTLGSVLIPRHTKLHSRPIGQPAVTCWWQTGYPVELWPIVVTAASLKASAYYPGLAPPSGTTAVLRLQLECSADDRFADLSLDRLRFFLFGDRPLMVTLYELLFNHTVQVRFRDLDAPAQATPIVLRPEQCLRQVGFELEEGLLPYPAESFVGYRLLTEFFSFPAKFTFLDLGGLGQICRAGCGRRLEVLFLLNRGDEELARAMAPTMFQLGCTPIINLFHRVAEPIALTHIRSEYKVIPDRSAPQAVEVYSVDGVSAWGPSHFRARDFQPFYTFHFNEDRSSQRVFWYASRRPSRRSRSQAVDVFLILVDRDFHPHLPADDAVSVHVTCHNGNLPAHLLRPGHPLLLGEDQASSIEHRASSIGDAVVGPRSSILDLPSSVAGKLLLAPTLARRPPLRRATFWRWLAQHALGQVPFSDAADGLDALKETLLLCATGRPDPGQKQQAAVLRQLIEGITALESRFVARPAVVGGRVGTCRGIEFTLELDRQKYIGTGAFMFACVIERFLGLHAHVNAFSQLQVRLKQGKGYLKKWPPRAADRLLA
jgi:type VI secretion system protein ImpG